MAQAWGLGARATNAYPKQFEHLKVQIYKLNAVVEELTSLNDCSRLEPATDTMISILCIIYRGSSAAV